MNASADILIFPVLGGYLLRIRDGSRRPPTAFLTPEQLRDLHEHISTLLAAAESPSPPEDPDGGA